MEHRIKERLTLDEVRELYEELAKDGRMRLVKDKEKIALLCSLCLLGEDLGKWRKTSNPDGDHEAAGGHGIDRNHERSQKLCR